MERQKFIETIERIKEKAEFGGNKITWKQMNEMFSSDEMYLDESQLKTVCAYLKSVGIEIIDGGVLEETEEKAAVSEKEFGDRDLEFVRMYQADLKNVKELSQEELIEAMKAQEEHREQIIHTFLKDVIKWVKPYAGGIMLMSDLIQEGNMGLMEGAAAFDYEAVFAETVGVEKGSKEQQDMAAVRKLREYLKKTVIRAAQTAVYAQESENNVGYKAAGRVNAVNDCARNLAEDMGRKVTMEELAKKLEMTYEEVKEIVDLSSDSIEYINYYN